jgi:hypothetical protein
MKTSRMMHTRMILAIVVILLLLLGTGVLAQPDGQYRFETATASGGGYQVASFSWQVTGSASGGDYHLFGPAAPNLRGSGCCCTYLPFTLRNVP